MPLPIPPNVRCAIHRSGSPPPAAAAASNVPARLEGAYDKGLEQAEEAGLFRYTHVMLVGSEVDVRDDFQEFTVTGDGDTVHVPDGTGTAFEVVFVEKINDAFKRVYLHRRLPIWPTADL